MDISTAINNLKDNIKKIYVSSKETKNKNIYRGHLRSISTDIEDEIAYFIMSILSEGYKIYLDPSIYIDDQNHRPDLLILNNENEIKCLIEIKSNMGWCRDAKDVIKKISENDKLYKRERKLLCKFSTTENNDVYYNDVKLFLISLTSGNCCNSNHEANKIKAEKENCNYYMLFDGWYNELENRDIEEFANKLSDICK